MDLQKKLDFIETYRNFLKTHHIGKGIEYTVVPSPKIKSGPVKIVPKSEVKRHGREERANR